MSKSFNALEVEEPLKTERLDPKFKFEVAQAPGGDAIRYCFQCGKCTATCPIKRFNKDYNPRLFMRAALMGLKETLLSSEVIWQCADCYSCTEWCPQGVRPSEVIRAIKNLASEEGYLNPSVKMLANTIVNFGRLYEEEELINEMRADVDLPPVPPVNLEKLKEILRNTKLKKLLASEKGRKKP